MGRPCRSGEYALLMLDAHHQKTGVCQPQRSYLSTFLLGMCSRWWKTRSSGSIRCSPLLPAKRTLDVSALLYILKSHKRFSILRLRVSAIKLPKDKTYIFDHHQSLLTIFFLNLGLTASILFVCFLMEMPKDVNNTVYG